MSAGGAGGNGNQVFFEAILLWGQFKQESEKLRQQLAAIQNETQRLTETGQLSDQRQVEQSQKAAEVRQQILQIDRQRAEQLDRIAQVLQEEAESAQKQGQAYSVNAERIQQIIDAEKERLRLAAEIQTQILMEQKEWVEIGTIKSAMNRADREAAQEQAQAQRDAANEMRQQEKARDQALKEEAAQLRQQQQAIRETESADAARTKELERQSDIMGAMNRTSRSSMMFWIEGMAAQQAGQAITGAITGTADSYSSTYDSANSAYGSASGETAARMELQHAQDRIGEVASGAMTQQLEVATQLVNKIADLVTAYPELLQGALYMGEALTVIGTASYAISAIMPLVSAGGAAVTRVGAMISGPAINGLGGVGAATYGPALPGTAAAAEEAALFGGGAMATLGAGALYTGAAGVGGLAGYVLGNIPGKIYGAVTDQEVDANPLRGLRNLFSWTGQPQSGIDFLDRLTGDKQATEQASRLSRPTEEFLDAYRDVADKEAQAAQQYGQRIAELRGQNDDELKQAADQYQKAKDQLDSQFSDRSKQHDRTQQQGVNDLEDVGNQISQAKEEHDRRRSQMDEDYIRDRATLTVKRMAASLHVGDKEIHDDAAGDRQREIEAQQRRIADIDEEWQDRRTRAGEDFARAEEKRAEDHQDRLVDIQKRAAEKKKDIESRLSDQIAAINLKRDQDIQQRNDDPSEMTSRTADIAAIIFRAQQDRKQAEEAAAKAKTGADKDASDAVADENDRYAKQEKEAKESYDRQLADLDTAHEKAREKEREQTEFRISEINRRESEAIEKQHEKDEQTIKALDTQIDTLDRSYKRDSENLETQTKRQLDNLTDRQNKIKAQLDQEAQDFLDYVTESGKKQQTLTDQYVKAEQDIRDSFTRRLTDIQALYGAEQAEIQKTINQLIVLDLTKRGLAATEENKRTYPQYSPVDPAGVTGDPNRYRENHTGETPQGPGSAPAAPAGPAAPATPPATPSPTPSPTPSQPGLYPTPSPTPRPQTSPTPSPTPTPPPPHYALGTPPGGHPGGPAIIGEGPEIVFGPQYRDLPVGSQVMGVNQTAELMRLLSGGYAQQVQVGGLHYHIDTGGGELGAFLYQMFQRHQAGEAERVRTLVAEGLSGFIGRAGRIG